MDGVTKVAIAGVVSLRDTFSRAIESLKKRLQPVANEALLSSQLMKRNQRTRESVSTYAQELEALFEKSYGKREGMELASKELLKRDLFVQGLSLKWQEKVLPSAATFADALHQAKAATSRTHCWENYTVGAHQISHHLQDPLSRIKVSEEENWRRDRTRGRPTLGEE